jgi:integrator complex subunit 1
MCTLIYNVYENEPDWPEIFIKAYIDDSLNERIWVDNPNCKEFVENIQTAFCTKPIPFSAVENNITQQQIQYSSDLQLLRSGEDAVMSGSDVLTAPSDLIDLTSGKRPQILAPRYVSIRSEIEVIVADMVRSYMNNGNKARQPIKRPLGSTSVLSSSSTAPSPIDNRNFLKLLQNTCGFSEIRAIVLTKLETWLMNTKV